MLKLPSQRVDLLKQFGVVALYALPELFASPFYSHSDDVAIICFGSGLALAVLLIGGKRYAWGVLLGSLLVHLTKSSVGEAAFFATTDTLEALGGYWLLSRNGKFDPAIGHLRDHLRLVFLAAGIGSGVAATIGSTSLLASGHLAAATYPEYLRHWWMSDALGIILMTPLILVWRWPQNNDIHKRQILESVLILGVTFLAGQVIFVDWFKESFGLMAKGYWIFLLITWVALRTGPRGITLALLMVASQALYGAHHGTGFFADDLAQTRLHGYWWYVVTLSIVSMSLATYFAQHKQTEKNLRESEARFRTLLEQMPQVAVQGYGADGTTSYWNEASERLYGYTAEEAIGKNLLDLIIPPEMRNDVRQAMRQMFETGQPIPASELTLMQKNGLKVEVFSSHAYVNVPGHPPEMFCIDIDLSDRHRAEAELRLASTAFESQEGILVTDANKVVLRSNRAFTRITGYGAEEMLGTTPSILQSGKQPYEFYRAMWDTISRDKFWSGEILDRRKNGELFPVWLTISAVVGPDGNITHYVGTFSDISEYKRVEQEKEESSAYSRSLIDAIPDAIFFKDSEDRWRVANEAATRAFRLQGVDWQGKTDTELANAHPEFRRNYDMCWISSVRQFSSDG